MGPAVYSPSKPAIPHRALLVSLAVFSAAASLAAGLTWLRAASPMGPTIRPPGWGVSIRIPRLFDSFHRVEGRGYDAVRFYSSPGPAGSYEVGIHRIRLRAGEAVEDACRVAIRDDNALVYLIQLFTPPPLEQTEITLGGLPGVELRDTEVGALVRGVVLDSRRAFCVSLRAVTGTLSDEVRDLFDASCASVQFDRPE